jgi:hypothetical protein
MVKYKNLIGKRIELIRCTDQYATLPSGTQGVVTSVDDAGTIHVKWDNGVMLGLIYEAGDRWLVISKDSDRESGLEWT